MKITQQITQNWKGLTSIFALTQLMVLTPIQSLAWVGHYENTESKKVECPLSVDLEFDHGTYAFILRLTGDQSFEKIRMENINQPEVCVDGKQEGFKDCFETQATADSLKWTQVTHFVPSGEIYLQKTVQLALSNQDQELNLLKSESGVGVVPASISCNYLKK